MQNWKRPFLFLRFFLIVAHNKITMKITVQSSNSNPVATDDTNITTIVMFSNCTTGVWMIVGTGKSRTDDLSVEIIATSVREPRRMKWIEIFYEDFCIIITVTHFPNMKYYEVI